MSSKKEYQDVKKLLMQILKKIANKDILDICEVDISRELLTGNRIHFSARDLLYFFFEIEKEFEMKIPEIDVVDGRFNNIDNIAKIICKIA